MANNPIDLSTYFDNIQNILVQAGIRLTASELQGILIGLLSGQGHEDNKKAILDLLIDEIGCTPEKHSAVFDILDSLHSQAVEGFTAVNFYLALLLPNDDTDLSLRVKAFADWCQGFLGGLALAGVSKAQLGNGLANEALRDLSVVAQTDISLEDAEGDEAALVELIEFARVAVQTIQVEIALNKRDR